ncbi:cytosolic protein [Peribacillus alkalitolerans]|uniref:cytosolic protein n=1 Tax=Peribacillus alkalitolerans TaxID=1550385 RepID=UPI0013D111D2|nr:cytosolic protein [Peribacillus alkalitolerans]
MGLFSSFLKRFDSQVETGDHNPDDRLKTHYYKADLRKVLSEIEQVLKGKNAVIGTVSYDHGELSATIKSPMKAFVVASIVSVRPFETALDFTISTEMKKITGNYNVLADLIHSLYLEMDQRVPIKK